MSNRTALVFGMILVALNVVQKNPPLLTPITDSDSGKEEKRQEKDRPAHPRDTPPDRERMHFRSVHVLPEP